MSVPEPSKILTPWATSGLKNTIPAASNPVTGNAGYDQGFPAINMTPKEAGGIPPFGQDFNGIFFTVTEIIRYIQAGGIPTFDSSLAAAISGYPKGAIVLGADGVKLWQNQLDGNTTNPDAPGTNWIDVSTGRLLNVQIFTSSGTYTPTSGTKSVIVEVVGGGGSGGASPATAVGQFAAAGGGGSGSYGKSRFTSGFSGVTVTIGAGGAAPAAGANNGNVGGTSSFGALMSCPGGTAGLAGIASNSTVFGGGGGGNSTPPSGTNIVGLAGASGHHGILLSGIAASGFGGSNPLGTGGHSATANGARPPFGYGSGSSGATTQNSNPAQPGVAGAAGAVIVWEYA